MVCGCGWHYSVHCTHHSGAQLITNLMDHTQDPPRLHQSILFTFYIHPNGLLRWIDGPFVLRVKLHGPLIKRL